MQQKRGDQKVCLISRSALSADFQTYTSQAEKEVYILQSSFLFQEEDKLLKNITNC